MYARVMTWLARGGLLRNPDDAGASNAPPELSPAEALATAAMQRGSLVTVRESSDGARDDDPSLAPPPPKVRDAVTHERIKFHASVHLAANDDVHMRRSRAVGGVSGVDVHFRSAQCPIPWGTTFRSQLLARHSRFGKSFLLQRQRGAARLWAQFSTVSASLDAGPTRLPTVVPNSSNGMGTSASAVGPLRKRRHPPSGAS